MTIIHPFSKAYNLAFHSAYYLLDLSSEDLMKSNTKYLVILLLVLGSVSCQKKSPIAEGRTYYNVTYSSAPRQDLDLYLPAGSNTSNTPLIILIHGGGWVEGDKTDFNPFIAELQKRLPTYAFANINYRLAANGQNLFPTQENDVKEALSFLVSKSVQYGYSQTIGLLGASAGGHLALLQSYKYTSPVKVKAVVSLFGPTNLTTLYNNPPNPFIQPALETLLGTKPSINPVVYQQSSPSQFVTNQSCPTLLLHGGNDIVVSPSQSATLRDSLLLSGVAVEYYLYPSEAHGWAGANLTDSYNKIEVFLKKYIQ